MPNKRFLLVRWNIKRRKFWAIKKGYLPSFFDLDFANLAVIDDVNYVLRNCSDAAVDHRDRNGRRREMVRDEAAKPFVLNERMTAPHYMLSPYLASLDYSVLSY